MVSLVQAWIYVLSWQQAWVNCACTSLSHGGGGAAMVQRSLASFALCHDYRSSTTMARTFPDPCGWKTLSFSDPDTVISKPTHVLHRVGTSCPVLVASKDEKKHLCSAPIWQPKMSPFPNALSLAWGFETTHPVIFYSFSICSRASSDLTIRSPKSRCQFALYNTGKIE